MASMDYCEFQNTASDLRACADDIDNPDLSPAEALARLSLVQICQQIVDNYSVETARDEFNRIKSENTRFADNS